MAQKVGEQATMPDNLSWILGNYIVGRTDFPCLSFNLHTCIMAQVPYTHINLFLMTCILVVSTNRI